MLKWISLVAVGVLVAMVFSFDNDEPPNSTDVERTGYFKSQKNDRVMAFYSENALTEDQVREVVAKQTLTSGALFRAVFYSGSDAPLRDGLTLAPNLQNAMETTANFDYFDWLVMMNPAGEMTIRRHK